MLTPGSLRLTPLEEAEIYRAILEEEIPYSIRSCKETYSYLNLDVKWNIFVDGTTTFPCEELSLQRESCGGGLSAAREQDIARLEYYEPSPQ